MNASKDFASFLNSEPPGQKTNAIRWLQKKVMAASLKLPRDFKSREDWEAFRTHLRQELPGVIGIPTFPPLKESTVRARIRVGEDAVCERVDVYVDQDYAIPAFVFSPLRRLRPSASPKGDDEGSPLTASVPPGGGRAPVRPKPGLVWNPGWPQDKWDRTLQELAVRMVRQGFVVITLDHAPFGETTPFAAGDKMHSGMTHVMGMGDLLGISQLALRCAETMRVGEYLRARPDVDPQRVAIAGLCQGGQDTWLTAALDERFCAAAPICSESTFTVHSAEMASYFANSDSSPYPFNILKVCDIDHLHAAIAPRPLLVRANLPDQWWPVSGFDDVETLTRKVYRLYGAEDRLDFRAEVHEHNITGPFADALEAFLLKYV
jgi:dienelactone hydrolase